MSKKKKQGYPIPVRQDAEPPAPSMATLAAMVGEPEAGKGFSHNNLCSLREVTNANLSNLREEMMEARASRAATIANLEAWRDELNEAIAILRAQQG